MPTPGFNFRLLVIMTTLFSRSLSKIACGAGWFGADCKNKCWCTSNNCLLDGKCVAGISCVTGWFGPSCQYKNAMIRALSDQPWINDGLIETCNPGAKIITIDFDEYYHFSWLRVIFKKSALGKEAPRPVYFFFKDVFNNIIDCTSKRYFNVDPRTIDIHCNMTTIIGEITLRGNEVLKICELFVNAGRNLALKQRTDQSTVLLSSEFRYSSSLAVDGYRSATFEQKSCSHTADNDSSPSWCVKFPASIIIYNIVIINRNVFPDLLANFTLKVHDAKGKLVQGFKEPGLIKSIYKISLRLLMVVYMICIETHTILTLCEFEAYGEIICPNLKWGLDCLDDCFCPVTEVCSPITGACDAECPPGFYGRLCETKCPKNCLNATCFKIRGTCINCKKGYMGDNCEIECSPNKYGNNCLSTCHSNCKKKRCMKNATETDDGSECSERLCNHDGWCNACLDNKRYGINCSLKCNTNCLFQRCDSKDGTCYSCKTGVYGKDCKQVCGHNCKDSCELRSGACDKCKSTFYGNNCSLSCPITCAERACHDKNGTCLKTCPSGLYGPTCSNNCPKTCKNQICHASNGSCIDGCEIGFFEDKCSEICPRTCSNLICDFSNGSCNTCDSGYYGLLCELQCAEDCTYNNCDIQSGDCLKVPRDNTEFRVGIAAPIAAAAVLLLIATLLMRKQRHGRASGEMSDVSY